MIKLGGNIPENYGSKWKMVGEGRNIDLSFQTWVQLAWCRKEEGKAEASAFQPPSSMCLQEQGVVVTGSKLPTTLLLGIDHPAQISEGQGEVEQDPEVLGPLRALPAAGTSNSLLVEA